MFSYGYNRIPAAILFLPLVAPVAPAGTLGMVMEKGNLDKNRKSLILAGEDLICIFGGLK